MQSNWRQNLAWLNRHRSSEKTPLICKLKELALMTLCYFLIFSAFGIITARYVNKLVSEAVSNLSIPDDTTGREKDGGDYRLLIEVREESEPSSLEIDDDLEISDSKETAAAKPTYYSIGSCASHHWPFSMRQKKPMQNEIIL